jgi:hypothetical protein
MAQSKTKPQIDTDKHGLKKKKISVNLCSSVVSTGGIYG